MVCKGCDEDLYQEFLDDVYPDVEVCGLLYSAGRVLREIDNTAFRTGMNDQPCNCEEIEAKTEKKEAIEEEIEKLTGNSEHDSQIKEQLEELESEVDDLESDIKTLIEEGRYQ